MKDSNAFDGSAPRQQVNTASLNGVRQVQVSAGQAAFADPKASKAAPLRNWIRHVVGCLGGRGAVSSPAYLRAALKIAVALTEQVSQAEKLVSHGVSDGLHFLSPNSAGSWADHVVVALKEDATSNGIDPSQRLTGASCGKDDSPGAGTSGASGRIAADDGDENQDVDQHLLFHESFGSFEVDFDVSDLNDPEQAEQLANHGISDELDSLSSHSVSARSAMSRSMGEAASNANHAAVAGDIGKVHDSDEQLRMELLHESFGSLEIDLDGAGLHDSDPPVANGTRFSITNPENGEHNYDDDNARLESFLTSAQNTAAARKKCALLANENEVPDDLKQTESSQPFERQDKKQSSHRNGDSNLALKISIEPTSSPARRSSSVNISSEDAVSDTKCFLDVESAQIQCPVLDNSHDKNNGNGNAARAKMERLYYLGLVFFELFSGGHTPPATLLMLPHKNNAFVSLSTINLMKKREDDTQNYANGSKRHHGPTTEEKTDLHRLSFEYLRLIGVPIPLCNLIFNMLDCVHGDMCGMESYSCIMDVTFDLQLMIDKPSKFMRKNSVSSSNMSSLASQLNEIKIPRVKEFELITSCYRRCISGTYEMVVIQGESGSGKSFLSQNVGRFVTAQGGIFLIGKFDHLQQAKPFAALVSAFDQYCDLVIKLKGSRWAKSNALQLKTALGQDACHLINVIPKLGVIIKDNGCGSAPVLDINCQYALHRFHHLFCLFLEVITSLSQVSVTLCMDDLQWADEASIAVLTRLLMRRNKKFFFVGCCRDNEMENDHPFRKMLVHTCTVGVNATKINLKGVEEDVLNQVMSELLCLSPRLVKPLSNVIYRKTRGNLLFFSQLVLSLYRDGLIYLDFDRERWMWDEEKILATKLPENVAFCYTNGIGRLAQNLQAALHILSMFGTSTKYEYIELLEKELGLNLIEPLKEAAAKGLVIRRKGQYDFCHDSIQQASYDMVGGTLRQYNHLSYGRCLAQRSAEINDDDMMFVALNHINIAGPSAVMDKDERYRMASYNYAAGQKAMEMAAFTNAYSFFKLGIAFLLRTNHWQDQYTFSLGLFELAMTAALAVGKTSDVQIYSNQLIKHAKCFEDTLNAQYIVMSSLAHSNMSKAVEKGADIVTRLGEDIPINPSSEILDHHIEKTQSMIRGISEEQLLNHPIMTDKVKLTIMKFLARLHFAFIVNPAVHQLVTVKMVQLSMTDGISCHSAFGFACFGSFLAKLGNLTAGHRFILLAKSLLNKFGANESAGELTSVVAEIQCYVEPLLSANELRVEGEAAALAVGDTNYACLCRLQYCADLFWAGSNLTVVDTKISDACVFVKQHEHITLLGIVVTIQRSVNILLGKETRRLTMNELSDIVKVDLGPRHKMVIGFHNLYLSVIMNDGLSRESCEEFFQSEIKSSCFLLTADSVQAYCAGLACFQIYRETRNPLWLNRAKSQTEQMKVWAEQGSKWNFMHKLLLMQAEEHYSIGNLRLAVDFYMSAIEHANLHRFQNDEALAYELSARFYFDTGDLVLSMAHFRLAHRIYSEWGAVGKAHMLCSYTNEKFAGALGNM